MNNGDEKRECYDAKLNAFTNSIRHDSDLLQAGKKEQCKRILVDRDKSERSILE